jgi:hypothetical protein
MVEGRNNGENRESYTGSFLNTELFKCDVFERSKYHDDFEYLSVTWGKIAELVEIFGRSQYENENDRKRIMALIDDMLLFCAEVVRSLKRDFQKNKKNKYLRDLIGVYADKVATFVADLSIHFTATPMQEIFAGKVGHYFKADIKALDGKGTHMLMERVVTAHIQGRPTEAFELKRDDAVQQRIKESLDHLSADHPVAATVRTNDEKSPDSDETVFERTSPGIQLATLLGKPPSRPEPEPYQTPGTRKPPRAVSHTLGKRGAKYDKTMIPEGVRSISKRRRTQIPLGLITDQEDKQAEDAPPSEEVVLPQSFPPPKIEVSDSVRAPAVAEPRPMEEEDDEDMEKTLIMEPEEAPKIPDTVADKIEEEDDELAATSIFDDEDEIVTQESELPETSTPQQAASDKTDEESPEDLEKTIVKKAEEKVKPTPKPPAEPVRIKRTSSPKIHLAPMVPTLKPAAPVRQAPPPVAKISTEPVAALKDSTEEKIPESGRRESLHAFGEPQEPGRISAPPTPQAAVPVAPEAVITEPQQEEPSIPAPPTPQEAPLTSEPTVPQTAPVTTKPVAPEPNLPKPAPDIPTTRKKTRSRIWGVLGAAAVVAVGYAAVSIHGDSTHQTTDTQPTASATTAPTTTRTETKKVVDNKVETNKQVESKKSKAKLTIDPTGSQFSDTISAGFGNIPLTRDLKHIASHTQFELDGDETPNEAKLKALKALLKTGINIFNHTKDHGMNSFTLKAINGYANMITEQIDKEIRPGGSKTIDDRDLFSFDANIKILAAAMPSSIDQCEEVAPPEKVKGYRVSTDSNAYRSALKQYKGSPADPFWKVLDATIADTQTNLLTGTTTTQRKLEFFDRFRTVAERFSYGSGPQDVMDIIINIDNQDRSHLILKVIKYTEQELTADAKEELEQKRENKHGYLQETTQDEATKYASVDDTPEIEVDVDLSDLEDVDEYIELTDDDIIETVHDDGSIELTDADIEIVEEEPAAFASNEQNWAQGEGGIVADYHRAQEYQNLTSAPVVDQQSSQAEQEWFDLGDQMSAQNLQQTQENAAMVAQSPEWFPEEKAEPAKPKKPKKKGLWGRVKSLFS